MPVDTAPSRDSIVRIPNHIPEKARQKLASWSCPGSGDIPITEHL
jgi:hypothetical protein